MRIEPNPISGLLCIAIKPLRTSTRLYNEATQSRITTYSEVRLGA